MLAGTSPPIITSRRSSEPFLMAIATSPTFTRSSVWIISAFPPSKISTRGSDAPLGAVTESPAVALTKVLRVTFTPGGASCGIVVISSEVLLIDRANVAVRVLPSARRRTSWLETILPVQLG